MILLITAACLATIWPDVHGVRVYDHLQLPVSGFDGRPLSLPAWREHVVVINFWSPDCAACVAELPAFQQTYLHFETSGLSVVGVAMPYDDPALAGAAAAKTHVTYPQGWDSSGRLRQVFDGIAVIPTTVVLAPGGRVVLRHEGTFTGTDLDDLVQAYLPPPNDGHDLPGTAMPLPTKR
jgi:thiol-disulfide isomerase/thioredoxin